MKDGFEGFLINFCDSPSSWGILCQAGPWGVIRSLAHTPQASSGHPCGGGGGFRLFPRRPVLRQLGDPAACDPRPLPPYGTVPRGAVPRGAALPHSGGHANGGPRRGVAAEVRGRRPPRQPLRPPQAAVLGWRVGRAMTPRWATPETHPCATDGWQSPNSGGRPIPGKPSPKVGCQVPISVVYPNVFAENVMAHQ